MKPLKVARKVEPLRVTRKTNVHVQSHGGEGWAISYADMLMVLLSFFVMFFSLKDEHPETFDQELKKISMSMEAGAKDKKAVKGAEPAAPMKEPAAKNYSELASALKIQGVSVIDEKTQLVVTLDDAAFKSAGFSPNRAIRGRVDEIMQKLKPFNKSIQLTVVGHTDSRRLVPRNEFLADNFDLSSLRALHVLKYVLARGFPERRATARAAASFDRAARSVSFVIQLIDASQEAGT